MGAASSLFIDSSWAIMYNSKQRNQTVVFENTLLHKPQYGQFLQILCFTSAVNMNTPFQGKSKYRNRKKLRSMPYNMKYKLRSRCTCFVRDQAWLEDSDDGHQTSWL